MKAQTKALVASVVVIALALSAVSGITYSWWSDTENSDITITTGDLDVSTSDITVGYTESGEAKTTSVSYADTLSISYGGANASSATVVLDTSKVDPSEDVTISYTVTFKATVNVKYLLDVDVPTTFEDVTTTKVTSGGTTFSALGVYQEDTTNALNKTYSVVITISELPRNATGIFKLTNYITQLPNTDAQAGTQDVSSGSATVTAGDASVTVSSIPTDAKTLKVVTTTDDSADTASIYLTLTDTNGNKITDFGSNVTVEVVLKGAYNGLYYNGTEAQPTVSSYEYSTDKTSWGATFETAKYTKVTFTTTHFSEFVAISTVEVSDASALATAIAAGGYVKLGANISVSNGITVSTDVILDLNGKEISTSSGYLIDVQADLMVMGGTLKCTSTGGAGTTVLNIEGQTSAVNLTLSNVDVVGPTNNAANAAIYAENNTGTVLIDINGGSITANHYPLNIRSGNSNLKITAEDATIQGYCAMQCHSTNVVFEFTDCTLIGQNQWNSTGDNNFAVIVLYNDATGSTVTCEGCTISAVEDGTAKEFFFDFRSVSTVVLNDCTYKYKGTTVTVDEIKEGTYTYISTTYLGSVTYAVDGNVLTITGVAKA